MWDGLPVVSRVDQADRAALLALLDAQGFAVFELDGARITDKASFFVQAAERLPLDPPFMGRQGTDRKWDALDDSLVGGLAALGRDRVAFLWSQVNECLVYDPDAFYMALDCFESLAAEAADAQWSPSPMTLRVFVIGDIPNPPLFVSPTL